MRSAPPYIHQGVGAELLLALWELVEARGWRIQYGTNLYGPDANDYRRPDLVVFDEQHASKRGIEGRAELVIEILSPHDESREKLPFYAARHIPEVWVIEPETRVVEIYTLRGGKYFAVAADAGVTRSPLLAIELATIDGPKLRVVDKLI